MFGFGVVATDSAGDLVQACTVSDWGLAPPDMAEALVIKEALSWIKDAALAESRD